MSRGQKTLERQLDRLGRGTAALDLAVGVLAVALVIFRLEPYLSGLMPIRVDRGISLLICRTADLLITCGLVWLLLHGERSSMRSIGVYLNDWGTQVTTGACSVALAYAALVSGLGVMRLLWVVWPFAEDMSAADRQWALLAAPGNVDVAIALLAVSTVMEEALFRGLILTRCRGVLGRWWPGVLLCSALFAAIHYTGSMAIILGVFMASIVWCLVFIRTGSLIAVTVGHFLFNCTQLALVRALGA